MPDIDQQTAQRIGNAARSLAIARNALEAAKDFETRKALQANLDRAQAEMIEASMAVNRGVSRNAPTAP